MSSVYVTSAQMPKEYDPLVFLSDFKESYYSLLDQKKYDEDKNKGIYSRGPDKCWFVNLGSLGIITVVDRVTGYMGSPRDVETGYRKSPYRGHQYHDFWLASGHFDIREFIPSGGVYASVLINKIKDFSNTVTGVEE